MHMHFPDKWEQIWLATKFICVIVLLWFSINIHEDLDFIAKQIKIPSKIFSFTGKQMLKRTPSLFLPVLAPSHAFLISQVSVTDVEGSPVNALLHIHDSYQGNIIKEIFELIIQNPHLCYRKRKCNLSGWIKGWTCTEAVFHNRFQVQVSFIIIITQLVILGSWTL